MAAFDIEMSYRLTSAIPLQYLREGHVADFQLPLVPFAQKGAWCVSSVRKVLQPC